MYSESCSMRALWLHRHNCSHYLMSRNPNRSMFPNRKVSEAWGTPQCQGKRSRSEKATLRALAQFQGILGAALRIRSSILGIRNSSHDSSNFVTRTTILGATPGVIPGIGGNPHERFSFAPPFSERFFENWGGPRAQESVIP